MCPPKYVSFRWLCWVALLVSCAAPWPTPPMATPAPPSSALQLTLNLNKTYYVLHEPIIAQFSLTNAGHQAELVNHRFAVGVNSPPLREIRLVITNTAGQDLFWAVRRQYVPLSDGNFLTVVPGESVWAYEDDIERLYDLQQPGTYTLQAIYENRSDPSDGRRAWQGELTSNVVTFTLAPPSPGISQLQLTYNLGKTHYEIGERLLGQAHLINLGTQPELLNVRLALTAPDPMPRLGEIELLITNAVGVRLPLMGEGALSPPQTDDFRLLAPGMEEDTIHNLTRNFPLTEPGTYTLQAIYRNTYDPSDGRRAWQGELASNVITFTLTAPPP